MFIFIYICMYIFKYPYTRTHTHRHIQKKNQHRHTRTHLQFHTIHTQAHTHTKTCKRTCTHPTMHTHTHTNKPPEISSHFRKRDLEISQSCWYFGINNFVVQIISLDHFQRIFWYKLIVCFITLYQVFYRFRIHSRSCLHEKEGKKPLELVHRQDLTH